MKLQHWRNNRCSARGSIAGLWIRTSLTGSWWFCSYSFSWTHRTSDTRETTWYCQRIKRNNVVSGRRLVGKHGEFSVSSLNAIHSTGKTIYYHHNYFIFCHQSCFSLLLSFFLLMIQCATTLRKWNPQRVFLVKAQNTHLPLKCLYLYIYIFTVVITCMTRCSDTRVAVTVMRFTNSFCISRPSSRVNLEFNTTAHNTAGVF